MLFLSWSFQGSMNSNCVPNISKIHFCTLFKIYHFKAWLLIVSLLFSFVFFCFFSLGSFWFLLFCVSAFPALPSFFRFSGILFLSSFCRKDCFKTDAISCPLCGDFSLMCLYNCSSHGKADSIAASFPWPATHPHGRSGQRGGWDHLPAVYRRYSAPKILLFCRFFARKCGFFHPPECI